MRVLIAEDDAVSRHLLQRLLVKWGYQVILASDGADAWLELQRVDAPKMAILDWMMPGMDGVQICRELRKRAADSYVYILMLTAKGRKQDIIEGLGAGGDDYLAKPFDPDELRARLRTGCRMVELHQQLIAAREALRVEATHDPLTGLWNRLAILEALEKELARSERGGEPVAVALADVDQFKHINDTYGHLAGDAVLREVARRMRISIRPYDAIGRYGGEEFLIITPQCGTLNAVNVAERLRRLVCREPVDIIEGEVRVTISLGVAASSDARQAEALLRAADEALYRSKNNGRNRVEVAALVS